MDKKSSIDPKDIHDEMCKLMASLTKIDTKASQTQIKTLWVRQNCCHFADVIFKCIYWMEMYEFC